MPTANVLAEKIERRQDELRQQRERQEKAEGLGNDARELLKKGDSDGAHQALAAAVSLWPELPGAAKLRKQIDKEIARASKRAKVAAQRAATARTVALDDTAPTAPTNPLVLAAAAVGLVALGATVWFLVIRQPATEELASPTESDTPTPVDTTPAEDPEIPQGLAAAQNFLARKEFGEAAREAQAVLDRAPDHGEAQGVLESANQSLASIERGVAEVQGFIDTSQFAKARDALSKVLDIAPSNPDVQTLLGQLNGYFKQSADDGRREMNQTKAKAQAAEAATLALDLFQSGVGIEAQADRLYRQKKFGEATGKFVEAEDTYQRAETEAQGQKVRAALESRLAAERQQADVARSNYEQAQTLAAQAGAETVAADGFRQAKGLGDRAETKYGRRDFQGAQRDFEAASEAMRQAQSGAGNVARAARDRVGAAKSEMEAAKKTAPGDSRGQAEETKARGLEQGGNLAEAEAAYRHAASLYRAAGRAQDEHGAVLAVLKSYELAIESKDLNALIAIWPTLGDNAKKYDDGFKYAQSWKVGARVLGSATFG